VPGGRRRLSVIPCGKWFAPSSGTGRFAEVGNFRLQVAPMPSTPIVLSVEMARRPIDNAAHIRTGQFGRSLQRRSGIRYAVRTSEQLRLTIIMPMVVQYSDVAGQGVRPGKVFD
jgi:hypothetical protein